MVKEDQRRERAHARADPSCLYGTPSGVLLMAFMNSHSGSSGNDNDMGPFDGSTKIVAVIALTVAAVFVFLGLILSLLRAMQQRAAERVCLVGD